MTFCIFRWRLSQRCSLPLVLVFGGCGVLPWLVSTLRQLLDPLEVVRACAGLVDAGTLQPLLALVQEWVYIAMDALEASWAIERLDALPKTGATVEH